MQTNGIATSSASNLGYHYEQLIASIDGILWEADARTLEFTYVSDQAARLLGYPVAQWFIPGFWEAHLHPDDRALTIATYRGVASENRNHTAEYRMIAADGRSVWLRDIVRLVIGENRATKLCGLLIDITEHKRAEEERQAHLWFLESMDRVNQAIQGANDREQMLRDLLDTLLAIFGCDRAWLLYPCDPEAATWQVSMERTQPEYAGVFVAGVDEPVDADMSKVFSVTRAASGPVKFGPAAPYPLPGAAAEQYTIQSAIAMTIDPKVDKPYLLGLLQCAYPRQWNPPEERLFQEIGRRLADALTSLLTYRRLQESELRYREIFDNTSDVIAIAEVTVDGRFKLVDVNPVLEKVLGISRKGLIGCFLDDFAQVHESARVMLAVHRDCLEKKEPVAIEREWQTPTGRWYTDFTVMPVCNASGQIDRIIGIGRNLTAQKSAENRLRIFLDQAADAFFLHDASGIVVDVNQRACGMLGYTREELIGMSPIAFDPTLDLHATEALNQRLATGETIMMESYHRRKDGTIYPIELRARAVWEGGQQFNVSLVQDITERKRVESELRASEARFRIFVDHATDGFFWQAAGGRIVDVNQQACESLGYTREELIGQLPSLFDPNWTPAIAVTLRQRLDVGEIVTFESHHRRKDGTIFPVEVRTRPFTVDGRSFGLGLVRDITARKQAATALKESEDRYRILYEDNPTMYFTIDAVGTVLSVNRFGAEHLGYTVAELTNHSVLQIFHEDDKSAAQHYVEECIQHPGRVFHWILRKVHKNGNMLWVEETARAVPDVNGALVVLIVCEDITELKHLEEQFRQAQKMEAVGRLAGGIAHDFNNLLTVINGYSQLIFKRLPPDDPNRSRLAEIQKAGERAANLTRQLLAFSRKQMLQPQVVDLNVLLAELLKLLQRLIGEDIELALTLADGLGLTKIDPGQFEQAIINLAVNARDAMPQGGRLTIMTCNTELDTAYAARYPEVQAGLYVCVTISDTGMGMTEATRARIFEPFFTTKDVGKGTGLGLAMVYGFVKQSDGHIEVVSEVGCGTTFLLYLPRTLETLPAGRVALELRDVPKGTETILLVEDEESVRNLARYVLQAGGYTVLEAQNGQKAVELVAQYTGPLDLLITDLVMPQMSGRQLAEQLVVMRPNVRLLFMSGYTAEALTPLQGQNANVLFLQKPFDPLSLAHKVREVLDGGGKSV